MKNHILNSKILHEAFKQSLETIKLRPKLKRPDKHAAPADDPRQVQHDPSFAKQIMGFREWCEKVYDRRIADSGSNAE